MPHVFNALKALNGTVISKLWIWDSLINIIPAGMFSQVPLQFTPTILLYCCIFILTTLLKMIFFR